jgi:hypothetical protein
MPPDAGTIGILGANPPVLARMARVVRAAADLAEVAVDDDPARLRSQLLSDTRLLICESSDLERMLEWTEAAFPLAQIVAWSHGPMDDAIATARTHPRVLGVLGWPPFLSMPRTWELSLAVRRALRAGDHGISVGQLFAGMPILKKFKPASSSERDVVNGTISELAASAGATGRMVRRISEVSHELLMNAMYDAPVNHYGEPRYAHDRRIEVNLDGHEVPTVRFASDGMMIAIQASDPFGRLTRSSALASIARGLAAARIDDPARVIDASHGGAGLGLWKIYSSSAVTIVDVIVGHATSVTAVFDIDVGPRESRTMPPSLHLF